MKSKNSRKTKPISFFESWRTLKQLQLLKDLIRHDNRWAHHIDLARSLRKLGLKDKDPHRHQMLREKINNLIPIAQRAAVLANVSTLILGVKRDINEPLKYRDREYDLLVHYDYLMSQDRPSARNFDMIIDILDQTIGYFREMRFRRFLEALNPLRMIAFVLRLPITILEYMGFDADNTIIETVLSVIIRTIWILLLAILSVHFSEKSEI